MSLYKAEYTDEALEQYKNLDLESQVKILGANTNIENHIKKEYKNEE